MSDACAAYSVHTERPGGSCTVHVDHDAVSRFGADDARVSTRDKIPYRPAETPFSDVSAKPSLVHCAHDGDGRPCTVHSTPLATLAHVLCVCVQSTLRTWGSADHAEIKTAVRRRVCLGTPVEAVLRTASYYYYYYYLRYQSASSSSSTSEFDSTLLATASGSEVAA